MSAAAAPSSSSSSSASSASASASSFDFSNAVAVAKQLDLSVYSDWTSAPLGRVVKDRLAGKVALITGGSSGIGAVTARRLSAEGAKVVLFARREFELSRLVSAIEKSGGEAAYFVGDASKEEDHKNVVSFTLKRFGGLHIAFNNAGIVRGFGEQPWSISGATFSEQMATNVSGVFFAVKHQSPAIATSGGGVIVNNASVLSFQFASSGFSIYPASKTWVVGYTQHVAGDLAKIGVRINAISPGPTISDGLGGTAGHKMIEHIGQTATAIGRAIKPEEIAAVVAFLASDEAQPITGIDLVIDGGCKIKAT